LKAKRSRRRKLTAHEDPDHGTGHCHHPYVQENCHACWNALPNTEARHRLSVQEYAELAELGKQVRRWARERHIDDDVVAHLDEVQGRGSAQAVRIQELQAEGERLEADYAHLWGAYQAAIAHLPRRER
jgi:hypothetical protein